MTVPRTTNGVAWITIDTKIVIQVWIRAESVCVTSQPRTSTPTMSRAMNTSTAPGRKPPRGACAADPSAWSARTLPGGVAST